MSMPHMKCRYWSACQAFRQKYWVKAKNFQCLFIATTCFGFPSSSMSSEIRMKTGSPETLFRWLKMTRLCFSGCKTSPGGHCALCTHIWRTKNKQTKMSMNHSQSWCLQHNHLKQLRHGLTVLEGTPCTDARYYSHSRPPMVRFEAYLVDTFGDSFWYILPVLNWYQYFLPSLSFANMTSFAVQLKGAGTSGWDAEEHPFWPLLECHCKGIGVWN